MRRIIAIHNRYQQPGGEDMVFAAETELLRQHGHEVLEYVEDNKRIDELNPWTAAANTIWSRSSRKKLFQALGHTKPDVAHFHNTFLLISPAAYYACREAGVPVVQTLHNYRLLCPAAIFSRAGQVCEDCLGKTPPWPGILHACYRESHSQSAVVSAMLTVHRLIKTWQERVDVYITLTEFARHKFIEGGLPADKIVVKPNFVFPDPGPGSGRGEYVLFVGRLSPEKGLDTLLAAWGRLGGRVPLKIVGDGPLASEVGETAQRLPGVEWLGRLSRDQVLALMKEAQVLLFPSVWYEGFPMVIAEAYAVGLPVIASNLGSISSLIQNRRTGLHFRTGDPEDLAGRVEWALAHPAELAGMRQEARAEFEGKYTAEKNYHILMDIYRRACLQQT